MYINNCATSKHIKKCKKCSLIVDDDINRCPLCGSSEKHMVECVENISTNDIGNPSHANNQVTSEELCSKKCENCSSIIDKELNSCRNSKCLDKNIMDYIKKGLIKFNFYDEVDRVFKYIDFTNSETGESDVFASLLKVFGNFYVTVLCKFKSCEDVIEKVNDTHFIQSLINDGNNMEYIPCSYFYQNFTEIIKDNLNNLKFPTVCADTKDQIVQKILLPSNSTKSSKI